MSIARAYGRLRVTAATAGSLYLDGMKLGDLPAGVPADLANIEAGERRLELRYAAGLPETKTVTVAEGQATAVAFSYKKASAGAAVAQAGFVRLPAGSFMMGSPASEIGREDDEGPQDEWVAVMG
jgi:formylglycine-generating enzyme required for sulfatase activity